MEPAADVVLRGDGLVRRFGVLRRQLTQ